MYIEQFDPYIEYFDPYVANAFWLMKASSLEDTRVFNKHDLILIPATISIYIHYESIRLSYLSVLNNVAVEV